MRIKLRGLRNSRTKSVRNLSSSEDDLATWYGYHKVRRNSVRGPGMGVRRKGTMEGTIWQIYPRQEKGMIRGDDGYEILF